MKRPNATSRRSRAGGGCSGGTRSEEQSAAQRLSAVAKAADADVELVAGEF